MRRVLLILILFIAQFGFNQTEPVLKKLGLSNSDGKDKITMEAIDELNIIAEDSSYTNARIAIDYSRVAYHKARTIEYAEGQVDGLNNMSRGLVYSNQMDSALYYANVAVDVANRSSIPKLQVQARNVKAGILSYMGQYDKAADEYFASIRLAEKHDPELALAPYVNLGHVFKQIGNIPKCLEYSTKAYSLAKQKKDTSIMLISLNLLGLAEYHEKHYDKALSYYQEGLEYAEIKNNVERQAQILYNIGNLYLEIKQVKKGFEYIRKSVEISKGHESYRSTGVGYLGLAETYFAMKMYTEAAQYSDSVMMYGELGNDYELIMEAYSLKAFLAKAQNNYALAYTYLNQAYNYKDSLNNTQLNMAALDAEDKFEQEKQHIADSLEKVQADLEAAHIRTVNEEKLRSRDILLWISAIIIVLVVIAVYFLYKNNNLIKSQNILVNNQKEEIQTQHNEIKDSINYAQRIQEAIIAKSAEWKKISEEHFILFKPKDIVSGDFYWAHYNQEKDLAVWAVADCTGHGVPGAFMSVLGTGFLNEIIIENGVYDPGKILDQLRIRVISALSNDNEEKTKDGMDISLCVWDKKNGELMYAGANNPLWIIRNGDLGESEFVKRVHSDNEHESKLYEIVPDKMPIGPFLSVPPPFNTRKIKVQEGDIIILITDGFADQFGGPQGKKFKYAQLKDTLLNLKRKSIPQYAAELETVFMQWKGMEEQLDDVCITGVKI